MMPVPVRVVVIVSVLLPVIITPSVILSVATETLFCRLTTLVDEALFTVIILNVVAPVMFPSAAPVN